MTPDEFTPDQLQALGAIRIRRREITDSAAEENRALLNIINSAAERRSGKRHRFMVLAGGIVGVSVPIMLQGQVPVDFDFVRVGSALLMLTIVIGAVFDAIDERRTNPLVVRAAAGVLRTAALTLAEDARMIATQAGQRDPELAQQEEVSRAAADDADADMKKAGIQFANLAVLEAVLFFGSFVIGVLLLMMAVGRASPGGQPAARVSSPAAYAWAFAQNIDNSLRPGELCRQSLAESLYYPGNESRILRQGESNIYVFSGALETYRIHGFHSQADCEAALTGLTNRQGPVPLPR